MKVRFTMSRTALIRWGLISLCWLFAFGCVRGRVLLDKSQALKVKLDRVQRPAMKCAPDRYASALAFIHFTSKCRQGSDPCCGAHGPGRNNAKVALGTAGRLQCEGEMGTTSLIRWALSMTNFDENADRDGCPEDRTPTVTAFSTV